MVLRIEKAKIEDVPYIHRLINRFAAKGEMLPRPLSEIYENIRDFFAARSDGEIVGYASLHILWADLAEIKGWL